MKPWKGNDICVGPIYSNERIEKIISQSSIVTSQVAIKDIPDHVCKLLVDGKIGGIFDGRSEFGPRALGNRSIIADPRSNLALIEINKNIK